MTASADAVDLGASASVLDDGEPWGMTVLPTVRVTAPARLHLGFLDPGASLGRRFGSLGLVVEGFDTVVTIDAAETGDDVVYGSGPRERAALPRASAALQAVRAATGVQEAVSLSIEHVPPAHAGFGTGTQLALAVGRAFAARHGLRLETGALARMTGRGLRSGVGIAGFDLGGLLLDAGPGVDGGPAPLIARAELPVAWRVLLVVDPRRQGLHGDAERAALAHLQPLPREQAAALCHDTLMQVLPGAMQGDFASFAAGLNRMQRTLGEHFAPAQGSAYASPAVGRLLEALAAQRPAAIGQSSWGPTGFAILPTTEGLEAWLAQARIDGLADGALEWRVVQPRSRGAVVAR